MDQHESLAHLRLVTWHHIGNIWIHTIFKEWYGSHQLSMCYRNDLFVNFPVSITNNIVINVVSFLIFFFTSLFMSYYSALFWVWQYWTEVK